MNLETATRRLLGAMDQIQIYADSRWSPSMNKPERIWYVIDTDKSDPATGYPGQVITMTDSYPAARMARAEAILKKAGLCHDGTGEAADRSERMAD